GRAGAGEARGRRAEISGSGWERGLTEALHAVEEAPLRLRRPSHRGGRLLQRPAPTQGTSQRLEELPGVVHVERAVHPEEGQRLGRLDSVVAEAPLLGLPPPSRLGLLGPDAPRAGTPGAP